MEYLIARESLFPHWKCIKETSLLSRARQATYICEQDISTFYPKWHSTSTIPSCQQKFSIKSKVRFRLMSSVHSSIILCHVLCFLSDILAFEVSCNEKLYLITCYSHFPYNCFISSLSIQYESVLNYPTF